MLAMPPKKQKTTDEYDIPGNEDAHVSPSKGVKHKVTTHLVV
jgi:hypothetical protein